MVCYLSKLLSKSKTSNKKEVPNRNAEEDFRLTINLDLPTKELSLATFRCIDLLKITDLNKYRLLVAYNTIEVPPPKIV